jgi:hypothetical protein
VFDILSPFSSSTRFPSLLSPKSVLFFTLIVLFVFSVSLLIGDLGYMNAQGSTDCNRQTFSLVNCPGSLSSNGEADKDHGEANIEQQIPSVIPFP